jgi:4'-phosphopantetheinyl transferase
LGRYLQSHPGQVRFVYNACGKPDLGRELRSRLKFNLSHSTDRVLIAVALDSEVGVDLECIRPHSGCADIAQRFFSAAELDQLDACPSELYVEAFLNCWTMKEAYVKACGEGLAIPLNSFSVPFSTPPALTPLKNHVASQDMLPDRRWCLYSLRPAPGYVGALAIEGTNVHVRRLQWNWSFPVVRGLDIPQPPVMVATDETFHRRGERERPA